MKQLQSIGRCIPVGKALRWLVAGWVLAFAGSAVPALQAQGNYIWSPITTGNFWLNSNNWTGGASGTAPGVDANGNSLLDNHPGDVATFSSLGFSGSQLGINMSASVNSGIGNNTGANQLLSVGAINWNSTTRAITLGKSDSLVATSTLRLNGATVTPGLSALSNVLVSISNNATFDFTIANTIVGGTGTMDLQLGITNGSFYVNTGRNLSISTKVTELNPGSGFTKLGSGTLTLSGASNYTGAVNVASGVLSAGSPLAFGTAAGNTSVASGAAVSLKGGVVIASESLSIRGTGGGATAGNSNGALQAAAAGIATWAGSITLDDVAARLGAGNGGTLIVSGPIQNGLANTLNIGAGLGGSGTVILSGANTYTGNTNILRGTLKLGADNALPITTILDVDSSNAAETATFDLAGYSQTLAGLRRTNPAGGGGSLVAISGGAASTLTVDQAIDTEFSGSIINAVSLEKLGAGKLTLSGSNTFGGATSVTGGILAVGNSSLDGTSAVTVTSGGTLLLGGIGERVNDLADITLDGGAISLEGVSGEIENLGNLILNGNAILDFGSGNGNTLLFNSLLLGGHTLSIYNWTGPSYYLMNADPGTDLTQDRLRFVSSPGLVGVSSQIRFYSDAGSDFLGNGKQVIFGGADFELVPIPEPDTLLAGLALLASLVWREGRRKLRRLGLFGAA